MYRTYLLLRCRGRRDEDVLLPAVSLQASALELAQRHEREGRVHACDGPNLPQETKRFALFVGAAPLAAALCHGGEALVMLCGASHNCPDHEQPQICFVQHSLGWTHAKHWYHASQRTEPTIRPRENDDDADALPLPLTRMIFLRQKYSASAGIRGICTTRHKTEQGRTRGRGRDGGGRGERAMSGVKGRKIESSKRRHA